LRTRNDFAEKTTEGGDGKKFSSWAGAKRGEEEGAGRKGAGMEKRKGGASVDRVRIREAS